MSDSLRPHGLYVACQASLSFTISQSLCKLTPIESVMPSDHLILSHPFLLLPSIFPSIRVFSNELDLHIRWSKCWSFNFSIRSSNEYSGFIFLRIDWFDILAVQGTLKSLLQHHNLKASILQHSSFFIVPLALSVCVCGHSCLILCNPMDCSLPGSSVHGILQARILE